MITVSVVIPTYNRKEKLKKVLEALGEQKPFRLEKVSVEIVVIDDGSTDGTANEISILAKRLPISVKYFRQKNKGPAAARNRGVKEARGKIIIFLGDDIVPCQNLIGEHLLVHRQYPDSRVAVLGLTTWAKSLEITPFMRWMEHGGHQFKYNEIKDKKWVDYRYFFTSNLSVKKKFLLENGLFDEKFAVAAYEDLELGYRLEKKGLKIFYNQNARAYHYHEAGVQKACQRMEIMGRWSALYNQKVPTSKRLPSWSFPLILLILGNPLIYFFLYRLALWCEKRIALSLAFNSLLLVHYVKGRYQ